MTLRSKHLELFATGLISAFGLTSAVYHVLTGALACSHAKWFHKLDFPVPDWPMAPFPQLRYPLEDFVRENQQEEQSCLEQVSGVCVRACVRACVRVCVCVCVVCCVCVCV